MPESAADSPMPGSRWRKLEKNPSELGKQDNHDQEPWKMPLCQSIEHLHVFESSCADSGPHPGDIPHQHNP